MATGYDVAARLADGLGALDELQTYISAGALRGHQSADVSLQRLRDSYFAEEGLDLRALDAESASLRAAASTAAEALQMARSQADALAEAWTGAAGAAVADFVGRHCTAARAVADGLRVAGEACVALRDALWQVVDHRVSTTQRVADGAAGRREWLAAARAVLAGQADQGRAGGIVDQQVIPFVDSVIRRDWMDAMHIADTRATDAYRAAVDAVTATGPVHFDVPGGWSVPATPAAAVASVPVTPEPPPAPTVSPAAAQIPSPAPEVVPPPEVAPAPAPAPASTPAAAMSPQPLPMDPLASAFPPSAPSSGLPGLGTAGLPDLGSLFGGMPDGGVPDIGLPEPDPADDGPDPDGPDEPQDPEDPDEPKDPEDPDPPAPDDPDESDCMPEESVTPEPAPEPAAAPAPEPAAPPVEPAAPLAAEAADPAEPADDPAKTPCEIAADELPQVGR